MEFILSVVAMLVAVIAMLAINQIIYKREKTLLEINNAYNKAFRESFKEKIETSGLVVQLNEEKQAYKKAIDDCIENFNAVYTNTKLSFDEDKCAFVIEDIDVDDSLSAVEEIMQRNENNDENQGREY